MSFIDCKLLSSYTFRFVSIFFVAGRLLTAANLKQLTELPCLKIVLLLLSFTTKCRSSYWLLLHWPGVNNTPKAFNVL